MAGDGRDLSAEHPAAEQEEENVLRMHEPIAREKDEPKDGFDPLPTWLLFIFFGLLLWGGWYLGEHGGDFRSDVMVPGGEMQPAAAAAPAAPPDPSELGASVYRRVCASCHQADGEGSGVSFPPLAGSEWVVGSPAILARIVLHGVQGPIDVAGQRYNGQMPGWGDQLDDAEVAAVLTHVRSNFGNDAAPVSPDLVARVREETSDRSAQWTVEELGRVDAEDAERIAPPDAGSVAPPEEADTTGAGDSAKPSEAPP
ncbi:MAG: c-type cytochrome [Myxococcota bacterium]